MPSQFQQGGVLQLPILSRGEVGRWHKLVISQAHAWIPRYGTDGSLAYFTLGRSVYLDLATVDGYSESAILETNRVLESKFKDLLELVKGALAQALNEPVEFSRKLALPGFHIFFSEGIDAAARQDPHFDLQHMRVDWGRSWDSGKSISYTLPLVLPLSGGGLELWSVAAERSKDVGLQSRVEPYTEGVMFLQMGMIPHRIAATKVPSINDTRITLQGHGLCFDGKWQLYW